MDGSRNAALLLTVGGLLTALDVGSAQTMPSFEVASVIENRSGGMTRVTPGLQPTPIFPEAVPTPAPGQISITNATLRHIIAVAFGLNPTLERYALKSGPDGILQTRFNIVAKPPDGALPSQSRLMLRTLLTDRFNLKTHTETQQLPAYVLKMVTEGRLGPELRPSPDDCSSGSMPDDSRERARLGPKDADGQPLCLSPYLKLSGSDTRLRYVSPLKVMLSYLQAFVDRLLIDETGLRGSFQWSVAFSVSASLTPGADPSGISIFTALREQLGLKLEQGSHPMDVVVVDSVEMPTPN